MISLVVFLLGFFGTIIPLTIFFPNYWLIFAWFPIGYIVGFILFAIFICGTLFYFNKTPNNKSKYRDVFSRHAVWFAANFALFVRPKIYGLENIPLSGNLVLYGNHRSELDVVPLLSYIKRPLAMSPKSSLLKVWFLKAWFEFSKSMVVYRADDRKTLRELVKAIDYVKNGHAIVLFPEGTTKNHQSEEINQSRLGAYKVAIKAEADIICFSILYKKAKRIWPMPRRLSILFSKTIPFESIKNLTTVEIDEIIRSKINAGIEKLKN